MKAPEGAVIHSTAGRFRISIAAAKGNAGLMGNLQEQLSKCPAVRSVKGNPVTGNLLVLHHGEPREIIRYAEEHSLFTVTSDRRHGPSISKATMSAYKDVDITIRKFSHGELDLPHAAFVALLGTGALQILRGRIAAPNWHTAFWYAFNFFILSQRRKKLTETTF